MAKVTSGPRTLVGVAALCAILGLTCLAGCSGTASSELDAPGGAVQQTGYADVDNMDFAYSDKQKDSSYDEASATKVMLGDAGEALAAVEGEGAEADAEGVLITQAGTYVLEGVMADGQVRVEAPEDADVKLVLAGVQIRNADGPAISALSGSSVCITLAEGSDNSLSDGDQYALAEGEDEPNAVLYSKTDLWLNGAGSLRINASYAHGINSKDDLVITDGSYEVVSVEDALRGKDCVKIFGGSFELKPVGDAIKSNNDEDPTRGFVSIDGGTFSINADDDGVCAFSYLRVAGGSFDVTTGGDAFKADADACISGGEIVINAGDDALHAEYTFVLDGGVIDVQSCVEGCEAERVYLNSAETHIVSSDDAVNAAAPETEAVARDGYETSVGATTEVVETCLIQFNGGYTVIDAGGDGIDSNGSVEVNGGVLLVEGPSGSADGVFDYGVEARVTGGTVLMVGSAGMAQSFSGGTQPFAMVQVMGMAGQTVALTTSGDSSSEEGELLASFTPKRDYQIVIVSNSEMADGGRYELRLGAEAAQANSDGFADEGVATGGTVVEFSASTSGSMMPGGMGGMGGMGDPGALRGEGAVDPGASGRRTMPDGAMPEGGPGDIPEGAMPNGAAPHGAPEASMPV